jgi:hypothetical protein
MHFIGKRAGPSPADPSPEGGFGPQGEGLWTTARYGPQAGEGSLGKVLERSVEQFSHVQLYTLQKSVISWYQMMRPKEVQVTPHANPLKGWSKEWVIYL